MKKLYIDFDGVILDTIKTTYELMDNLNIDKNNQQISRQFYRELDWNQTLKDTPEINYSINNIKKLMKSKKFDIAVLTHIVTYEEGVAKIEYLQERIPELSVILVPKEFSKTQIVNPEDSILIDDYTENLREWKSKGGIGIKFSSSKKPNEFPVITSLEEISKLTYK